MNEYSQFLPASKHLLHSDFYRVFITSIGILEYIGNERPFAAEFVTPYFTPNTYDGPWKPWHHVYSNCKAGKGQKHNPTPNKRGKYVVRIFWLGAWRKVYVDDLFPVDRDDNIMLPTLQLPKKPETIDEIAVTSKTTVLSKTDSKKSKSTMKSESKHSSKKGKKSKSGSGGSSKKTKDKGTHTEEQFLILWPFLLCKALLKVGALTHRLNKEVNHFDIVTSLTGWVNSVTHLKGKFKAKFS